LPINASKSSYFHYGETDEITCKIEVYFLFIFCASSQAWGGRVHLYVARTATRLFSRLLFGKVEGLVRKWSTAPRGHPAATFLRYTFFLRTLLSISPRRKSELKEVSMKIMSTYSVRPGCIKEAAARFLAGEGAPEEGVKLLGRWHRADGSGGFVLHESDSPEAMMMGSMKWADVLEIHGSVVVDDNAAGAAMTKYHSK
jgi:hypothetical protein